MEYFKASEEHAEQIYNLVQNTITAVYPRYYPEAVVDFFCSLHNSCLLYTSPSPRDCS